MRILPLETAAAFAKPQAGKEAIQPGFVAQRAIGLGGGIADITQLLKLIETLGQSKMLGSTLNLGYEGIKSGIDSISGAFKEASEGDIRAAALKELTQKTIGEPAPNRVPVVPPGLEGIPKELYAPFPPEFIGAPEAPVSEAVGEVPEVPRETDAEKYLQQIALERLVKGERPEEIIGPTPLAGKTDIQRAVESVIAERQPSKPVISWQERLKERVRVLLDRGVLPTDVRRDEELWKNYGTKNIDAALREVLGEQEFQLEPLPEPGEPRRVPQGEPRRIFKPGDLPPTRGARGGSPGELGEDIIPPLGPFGPPDYPAPQASQEAILPEARQLPFNPEKLKLLVAKQLTLTPPQSREAQETFAPSVDSIKQTLRNYGFVEEEIDYVVSGALEMIGAPELPPPRQPLPEIERPAAAAPVSAPARVQTPSPTYSPAEVKALEETAFAEPEFPAGAEGLEGPSEAQLYAMARGAATYEQQADIIRQAVERSEPTSLIDMLTGEHRIRSAKQIASLFPKEFAARAKTEEEIESEIAGREALTKLREASLEAGLPEAEAGLKRVSAEEKEIGLETKVLKRPFEIEKLKSDVIKAQANAIAQLRKTKQQTGQISGNALIGAVREEFRPVLTTAMVSVRELIKEQIQLKSDAELQDIKKGADAGIRDKKILDRANATIVAKRKAAQARLKTIGGELTIANEALNTLRTEFSKAVNNVGNSFKSDMSPAEVRQTDELLQNLSKKLKETLTSQALKEAKLEIKSPEETRQEIIDEAQQETPISGSELEEEVVAEPTQQITQPRQQAVQQTPKVKPPKKNKSALEIFRESQQRRGR